LSFKFLFNVECDLASHKSEGIIMQTWAAQELRTSNLGDARLDRRLVEIVDSRQAERSA